MAEVREKIAKLQEDLNKVCVNGVNLFELQLMRKLSITCYLMQALSVIVTSMCVVTNSHKIIQSLYTYLQMYRMNL